MQGKLRSTTSFLLWQCVAWALHNWQIHTVPPHTYVRLQKYVWLYKC